MDLNQEIDHFLQWLRRHGLPGFRAIADDTYADDDSYETISAQLEYLGGEMKKSVQRKDRDHFFLCKDEYLKRFEAVNKKLAIDMFENIRDNFINNEGYEELDAQYAATEMLWQQESFRFWLPVQLRLTNQETQERVFLVANERHIPPGDHYVLIEELESLKNSERDPWEYIRNRKAV